MSMTELVLLFGPLLIGIVGGILYSHFRQLDDPRQAARLLLFMLAVLILVGMGIALIGELS